VLPSARRDLAAARRFLTRALRAGTSPPRSPPTGPRPIRGPLEEMIPSALHTVERYVNNPVETDHGRLKA
jgi:IS6 family transposase